MCECIHNIPETRRSLQKNIIKEVDNPPHSNDRKKHHASNQPLGTSAAVDKYLSVQSDLVNVSFQPFYYAETE